MAQTMRTPSSTNGKGAPARAPASAGSPTPSWVYFTLGVGAVLLVVAVAPGAIGKYVGWPVAVVVLLGVAVGVWWSVRRARCLAEQQMLHRRLAKAVTPLLGYRGAQVPSSVVRTRHWKGRPPRAQLVELRYEPTVTESAAWTAEVVEVVEARMLGTYTVAAHDQVRGKLQLRRAAEEADSSGQVARARRITRELLGGATAQVSVHQEAGEVVRIEVEHQVGAKLVASGYRSRVERSISAMMPGRWRAQWDLEADSVVLEQRPTLPESVWLPPLPEPDFDPLSSYDQVEIPYGVDEDQNVMSWKPAITPHLLLVGATGGGKTSTAHAILGRVTQYGWPVWVVDGKAVEFLGFRDWPNVQLVASTVETQVAAIRRAWELMEYRYQLITEGQAKVDDFEPLLLFVDEYTDFRSNLLSWYGHVKAKGDPRQPATLDEVASIARKGRTARVHLVLATQRADAAFLTGELRENLGARITVGRITPQSATMVWENPAIGVTIPRGRRGRAMAMNDEGRPVEMQCYRTPAPEKTLPGTEEAALLDRLRPTETHQERLLILDPDVETDLDTGEQEDPTFTDYTGAGWVKAADRPDLDPLARRTATAVTGKALASPMSMLGLAGDGASPPAPNRFRVASGAQDHGETERGDSRTETSSLDLEDDGYGAPQPLPAGQLSIGDLVLVEEDLDHWGVVDEDPEPDFDDEDSVVINWRDDEDDAGQLLLPNDSTVTCRRPRGDA